MKKDKNLNDEDRKLLQLIAARFKQDSEDGFWGDDDDDEFEFNEEDVFDKMYPKTKRKNP